DAKTDEIHWLEAESASLESGGFESCRQELWGSATAKRLGLTLLPMLAEQDLYAEGDTLLQLESEAQIIHQSVDMLAKDTGYPADFIAQRTRNILTAVAKAVARGGVVIW